MQKGDTPKSEPTINFDAVPEHVKEDLAESTLSSIKAFLMKPGGKEFLDARIAKKKAAQAAQ